MAMTVHKSVCPHDCPSTCALEIEKIDAFTIGRVRGAKDNTYTDGVICSKVARYAERAHHPDRLTQPMRRVGDKGGRDFEPIGWDDALDIVAEAFAGAETRFGSESVWPHFYAGTMGLVMRDGINRLRHAKRYSGQHNTICTTLAWEGFVAGTGRLAGPDPREMALADVVVIWGTNPVNTQVNVMTHAVKARKNRGARIVVIDTYRNGTADQADMFLRVNPGTDGALACAVMHVLFRDGLADREFLALHTDDDGSLERHLAQRSPAWASAITGVPTADIEAFAALIGGTPRTYLRLGYGFSRSRNGAVNMHAANCIASVAGLWRHEGGGAFHNNRDIFGWDKTLIEGLDKRDPNVRVLDQCRIGAILCGEKADLKGGPPVTAMLIQNTNPLMVSPDQTRVREGFKRDDLFVCVHEQFLTETARYADIVLPATMFVEHDDVYQGGGHQHILLGPKIVDAPGDCRSNHAVICALAERLGADHPGFRMTERELIDATLRASGRGTLDELEAAGWIDCQPPFDVAHFIDGFGHADGRFHFRADWRAAKPDGFVDDALLADMPSLPDHWAVTDNATADRPFRLVTAPARSFLNSSFTETPTSVKREGRPTVMIHPDDAASLSISNGDRVCMGNEQGVVTLHAAVYGDVNRGVVISESIWPNEAFEDGRGINTLTTAEASAPVGGGAFHDTSVWIRPA
ncbi:MAG: molybdopterin oxidoreductase family protein [Rhodospirillales bacterium]